MTWVKQKIQIGPDTQITSQLINDLIADENWICLGMALTKLVAERDGLKLALEWEQLGPFGRKKAREEGKKPPGESP